MFKPKNPNHEKFEELCALAAIGQISANEFSELKNHLDQCPSCRSTQQDFLEIIHEHLPLIATDEDEVQAKSSKVAFHDSSYKQRFLQRILQEGLLPSITSSMKTKAEKVTRYETQTSWSETIGLYALSGAAAVVLAMFSFTGFGWYWNGPQKHTNEVKYLKEEVADIQQKLSLASQGNPFARNQVSRPVFSPSRKPPTVNSSLNSNQLLVDLTKSKANQRLTLKRLNTQIDYLGIAEAKLIGLNKKLEKTKNFRDLDSKKLDQLKVDLQTKTINLEAVNQLRSNDQVRIQTQKNQIIELTKKLQEQMQVIKRERELLAAGKDIRDLMGARNLHIIDVADVDGSGDHRSLGRVFYTEGKSLIFYAYDLEKGRASMEKFSLQAWGQQGTPRGSSAQSLGVFFTDDRNQDQWVLQYNDPKVLAEIDAVFVTLEPKGGSMKPRGEKLMYAYLKANPNHP